MTECPKCGYTRQHTDSSPDYECPKCGVVYAKYLAHQEEVAAGLIAAQEAELKAAEAALFKQRKAAERAQAQAVADSARQQPPKVVAKRGINPVIAWGSILAFAAVVFVLPFQEQSQHVPSPRPVATPIKEAKPLTLEEQVAASEKRHDDAMLKQATEICHAEIRRNASFPSTVDIAWFLGTSHTRPVNSDTTIMRVEFTAQNALGAELPFFANCQVSDSGQIMAFNVSQR